MWLVSLLMAVATSFVATSLESSKCDICPFCDSVKQTLRQEMESMDAVAIGVLVPNPDQKEDEFSGVAQFQIVTVIKGEDVISVGQQITAPYFGSSKSTKRYLLQGVDPAQMVWTSPLALTKASETYLLSIPGLPTDTLDRLKFFMKFLENEDSLLARDAYDEFAISPYDVIKQLKPDLSRELLLKWLTDKDVSVDRKRLYFTLLGICGLPEDADLLEARMKSENADDRAGLDAMVACYLTLKGDAGLPLVESLFLSNPKSPYPETYSAIMALRFHGTEGGVLDRAKVVQSVRLLLDRPEMADLVIPDLAKWEDWTQIDKLVKLFKEADDSTWVRMPVVNYLRVCPLPEAKEVLIELEKIDPKTIQRAKTFFPVPTPAPAKADSSQHYPRLDVGDDPRLIAHLGRIPNGVSAAATIDFTNSKLPISETEAGMNRWKLGFVATSAGMILGLSMWLVISRP